MNKLKKGIIDVQGTSIMIISSKSEDYICITDIAKSK
jgi:hypothetical protein